MSMLNDNLDANFQLFIEQVRESGQVWGLRYGEDWVVCRSAEFEDADVMPLWSAEEDARLHCVDEWADYEPEVIDLESFSISGSTIWMKTMYWSARTGTPIWKAKSSNPSSWPRHWLNWTPESASIDGLNAQAIGTKTSIREGAGLFYGRMVRLMS